MPAQVENVGAWAAGRPSAPGRYGSINASDADFLAASELQFAGLSEVRTASFRVRVADSLVASELHLAGLSEVRSFL